MLHKIPLGLAALVAYGMYVALGNDSCQMANRSVMPIHWVGYGLNFVTNNLHASNNEANGDSVLKGFDSSAAYVRDGLLVLGQGKAFCTTFQASLIAPPPSNAPAQAPVLTTNQESAPASPLLDGPTSSSKPVFHAPIGSDLPIFVTPLQKGAK